MNTELKLTRCSNCSFCKRGQMLGGKFSKTCSNEKGLKGYLEEDAGCIYGSSIEDRESEYYISQQAATQLRLDLFLDSYVGPSVKFRLADYAQSLVHKKICYLRPSCKFATSQDIKDPKHKWNKYMRLCVNCMLQLDAEYPDCVVIVLYVPGGY